MPGGWAGGRREILRCAAGATADHLSAIIEGTDRQSGQSGVFDALSGENAGGCGFSQNAFGDCADCAAGDLRYAARTNGRGARESGADHPVGKFLWRAGASVERAGTVWTALRERDAKEQRDWRSGGARRNARDGATDGPKGSVEIAGLGIAIRDDRTVLYDAVRGGDAARRFGARPVDAHRRGRDSGNRDNSSGNAAGASCGAPGSDRGIEGGVGRSDMSKHVANYRPEVKT